MTSELPCRDCVKRHEWRRDLVLFGALLVVLFGTGYATLVILIDRIEAERGARVETTAALVEQVCRRDNGQDRVLASLVHTTIAVSESPRVDRVFAEILGRLSDLRRCEELARAYVRSLE